jgi:lipid-A-disaccharide synthase
MSKKIYLSAGEASGDLLGAQLSVALLEQDPSLILMGMGGQKMRAAGVRTLIEADKMAIVGVVDVLKQFSVIRAAFRIAKNTMLTEKPDLMILIDYPGFNLRLAKIAKKMGIKVMFYVSPQIWAWRYSRIKRIKKYVDKMAVLFQFEEPIYQRENVPVQFVGHPLVDSVKPTLSKEQVYKKYDLDPQRLIIALMPGSRKSEIARLMPTIIDAVLLIKKRYPEAQFVLPLASTLKAAEIKPYLIDGIKLCLSHNYNLLSVSDALIVASGTATLEAALLEVPMTIIYRLGAITHWFGKRLLKLPHMGLCNIILGKTAAKELIQNQATPKAIADETLKLVEDELYRNQLISDLQKVRPALGISNGSALAATCALELVS